MHFSYLWLYLEFFLNKWKPTRIGGHSKMLLQAQDNVHEDNYEDETENFGSIEV